VYEWSYWPQLRGVPMLTAFRSILGQPATLAIGTGLLAGAVSAGAVVGSGALSSPARIGYGVLSCPVAGAVVTHALSGTTVLVTARSADGSWLQLYVGQPGAERGWLPAGSVRLLESPAALPVVDCGPSAPGASPAPPTPAPTATPVPSPTALAIDACAALDQSTAEAIAGTPLLPALVGAVPSQACQYPGPPDGPEALVSIFVGDSAKGTYDTDRALNHHFREVAGIGDEAWLEDDNVIFFRKGATWYVIELVRLNNPMDNDQRLIDGARTVASRLPS